LVFVTVEVVAFVLILVMGHTRWFFNDDWDFLTQRSLGSVSDLLRPHYEHWVTLPLIAYRLLWWIFGANTYLPYQLLVVLGHLGIAALLRVVMRRVGVGPWIATAAAGLFAMFGAGYDNLFSAFQITFVWAVLFGLVQLLLADHDGRINRLDWFGVAAGLAAIMCSLVGVPMVTAVGLAALIRRGWRAALFHVGPLAYIFAMWWLVAGGHTYAGYHNLAHTISFMRIGLTATFEAVAQVRFLGIVVAVGLFVGLVSAWGPPRGLERRRVIAMPAALLAGAFVFLAITGWGRSGQGNGPAIVFGPEHARESRYLDVVAALLLPALAVAASALIRRWKMFAPILAALLAISLIGNVKTMNDQRRKGGPEYVAYRRMLLGVPSLPRVAELPRDLEPDRNLAGGVTVGWLTDNARAGKLPSLDPPLSHQDATTQTLLIALQPQGGEVLPATSCQVTHGAVTVRLDRYDTITLDRPATMQALADDAPSAPVSFAAVIAPPYNPHGNPFFRLRPRRALIGPIVLRITPRPGALGTTICTTGTRLSTRP
jgi:hypothetical protein